MFHLSRSHSSLVSNGTEQLNVNGQPGISQVLSPYIAFTPGKQYKLSFDLLNITAGNYLIVYTMYPYNYFVTWIGDNGHYEIMFTASAPSMQLYMNFQNNNSTAPVTFSLDNIRFEQIPGVNLKGYTADVIQANDYSPFGAPLPGRNFNSKEYRFGFNGKEKDDETYGEGNEYDFGDRIYSPRLGRWLSVDPLQKKYSWLTPYHFTANNPILYVDKDGRDYGVIVDHKTRTITVTATYYTTAANQNEAQSAVNHWNGQSGKFAYEVKNGDKTIQYNIKYELKVDATSTSNIQAQEKAVADNTGNQYRECTNCGINPKNAAETGDGEIIRVDPSKKAASTGSHEIGHTLGLPNHFLDGLQKPGEVRHPNETNVTPENVAGTLDKVGLVGPQQETKVLMNETESKPYSGKSSITEKNVSNKPANFNSGTVKENKKK